MSPIFCVGTTLCTHLSRRPCSMHFGVQITSEFVILLAGSVGQCRDHQMCTGLGFNGVNPAESNCESSAWLLVKPILNNKFLQRILIFTWDRLHVYVVKCRNRITCCTWIVKRVEATIYTNNWIFHTF